MEALWGPPGRSWDALGALLGRSWDALGRSWDALGRSWAAFGVLLGRFAALLAALGPPLGDLDSISDPLRVDFSPSGS